MAHNFGGDHGVIIWLNNNGDACSAQLRCFECAWVSTYKEEAECLFFGGKYKIRMESILLVKTASNYALFFHALFWMDCMLSGSDMDGCGDEVGPKDKELIMRLLNKQTKGAGHKRIDQYISDTFDLFCSSKKSITINMHYVRLHYKEIFDLIEVKLFRQVIPNVFPSVDSVRIYSTSSDGKYVYPIDIHSIVHKLPSLSNKLKITIIATHAYKVKMGSETWKARSWIYDEYPSLSRQCRLTVSHNSYGRRQDCLTMTRGDGDNNAPELHTATLISF